MDQILRKVVLVALAVFAPAIHAQTTFTGRVVSDSGAPLVGAEVVIAKLQKIQRTDTNGEFRITGLPSGDHIVGIRMFGFAPKGDTIEVADAGEVRREYRLKPIATKLPEVPVTARSVLDRKLVEFYERRGLGVGRFLDSAEFANTHGTRMADRLAKLPGVMIQRGRASEAFVANTRQRTGGEPGSNSWCRAAIWLDGVNLGTQYNVNELDPSMIAAVEWYAGQASIPAKYNTPPRVGERPYCGVLVIWLR